MKLAIMGGTFNPPHFGHLFLANEIRQSLKLDKIIFVPSEISAHKDLDKSITSTQRLEMLKLAIDGLSWADTSDCDITRGGVTRTVDTIKDIRKEYKLDSKPGFIIGDDLVNGFQSWKEPDKIVKNCNLIVGNRSGIKINLGYKHQEVKNRQFPLSSSEIRERVSKNIDIDFLVPSNVIKYIKKNGLYRNN